MTRDERIFEIATAFIRKSFMKRELWRATLVAEWPATHEFKIQRGELPLGSATFPDGDWYVWTTRRLVSVCEGIRYELAGEDIGDGEFGIFKVDPDQLRDPSQPLRTLIATIHDRSGSQVRLRYEVGYAAMLPVQCHQYWKRKHPHFEKLMTSGEVTEYLKHRSGTLND